MGVCNHEEYSEFGRVLNQMLFKGISNFNAGVHFLHLSWSGTVCAILVEGHFVQRSGTVCANVVEGILGNIDVKLF